MLQSKKPVKIYELINWLIGSDDNIPNRFLEQRTKLNSLVPYITEQLWTKPDIVWYLNKHTNNLFKIPDPIEMLVLLKKLFKYNRITKFNLYQKMPNFKPDIIKEIEKKEGYDDGNARSKETMLLRKFGMMATQELYKKQKMTKAAVKQATTEEDKSFIKNALEHAESKEKNKIPKANKGIYLKELNQEIIDSEELVLFDISLLKKRNQVLFIFIDKNNHKKYYLMPFMAKIYISKQDGVINNDYIEEITDDKFNGYIISNIQNYTRLKYMLNDSYKRIINGT